MVAFRYGIVAKWAGSLFVSDGGQGMSKQKSQHGDKPVESGVDVAAAGVNGRGIAEMPVMELSKKAYKEELARLQVKMFRVQEWVVGERLRAVVILEGLGPAGKRGTAQRIAGGMDQRVCKVVTLDPAKKRERAQWHYQRYVEHFPSAGKITILDGSWYHSPATQRALGSMPDGEFSEVLRLGAEFERTLLSTGVTLVKFWFTANDAEQERRFRAHMVELGKRKNPYLAGMPAAGQPVAVTDVRDQILSSTGTAGAPWHTVVADDRRRARIECMRYLLSLVPGAASQHGGPQDVPVEEALAGPESEAETPDRDVSI
jgi:polyphosphate kinase 2 (PPK2 family)